jgi:hypothetical protein
MSQTDFKQPDLIQAGYIRVLINGGPLRVDAYIVAKENLEFLQEELLKVKEENKLLKESNHNWAVKCGLLAEWIPRASKCIEERFLSLLNPKENKL